MLISVDSKRLAGTVLAASLALGTGTAMAEPQVLALVATLGKVALTCEGGECGAEFSSFCLQRDRFSPAQDTPYVLANTGGITLVGVTGDGREISFAPGDGLKIRSRRAHVAVRISMPRQRFEALGLQSVALVVGENVALLPDSKPGVANARDETEMTMVTGALRGLGTRIVDHNVDRMMAARITNRVINALPARTSDEATREKVWRGAIGDDRLPAAAIGKARGVFELCKFARNRGSISSMRACLQSHHDQFIDYLNTDYWKAVNTGS